MIRVEFALGQNCETLSGSEYSYCGRQVRESGHVGSLISVFHLYKRISASVEDPVVLFRSLPRPNDITTQAITYNLLSVTDYRSAQPTLKALYSISAKLGQGWLPLERDKLC